jgi:hypothetical protein
LPSSHFTAHVLFLSVTLVLPYIMTLNLKKFFKIWLS